MTAAAEPAPRNSCTYHLSAETTIQAKPNRIKRSRITKATPRGASSLCPGSAPASWMSLRRSTKFASPSSMPSPATPKAQAQPSAESR